MGRHKPPPPPTPLYLTKNALNHKQLLHLLHTLVPLLKAGMAYCRYIIFSTGSNILNRFVFLSVYQHSGLFFLEIKISTAYYR